MLRAHCNFKSNTINECSEILGGGGGCATEYVDAETFATPFIERKTVLTHPISLVKTSLQICYFDQNILKEGSNFHECFFYGIV